MIGRGLRIAEGKRDLLVLDFRGNAGKHKLASAFDVLGGEFTARTRELAEHAMDGDEALDILAGIDAAHRQEAEEHKRAELAAAKLRALRDGAVRYHIVDVDAFALLGVQVEAGRWNGAPITAAQKAVLERSGIATQGLDKGQAHGLIDAIIERRKKKLCTYKMAKVLGKYGFDPDVSFVEASALIDRIRANHWRRPMD